MKRYTIKLEEMSNLYPQNTGVNFIMWLSTKSGREKHNARIKITNTEGEASISLWGIPEVVSKKGKIVIDSKEFKQIKRFIEVNRETLLAHWNGEIDSVTFAKRIKKV